MLTRDRLLKGCLAYFLRFGVANVSLRPLAAANRTSARMLLHYFGSKEQLITEVMQQVSARLQRTFAALAAHAATKRRAGLLPSFWEELTKKSELPYLRLLFEVQILALQNPSRYQRYLSETSGDWLRLVQSALPPGRDRAAFATLATAVIDGLLLEFLSTGDKRRTTAALRQFVELLQGQNPPNEQRR